MLLYRKLVYPNSSLRSTIVSAIMSHLPYFTQGHVSKGFGRGSKELGCATANLPDDVVNDLPSYIETGIYFGFASVNNGEVHKMVMSVGWNPYYQNTMKSMEVHIIHKFDHDFYGSLLKVCILGYLRPEKSFSSLDELIIAINKDIDDAKRKLDEPQYQIYKAHNFFKN